MTEEKEIPQLKKLKPKVAPGTVVQAVCQEFDCGPEQIIIKGRKKNKAREVAIYPQRDYSIIAVTMISKIRIPVP